MTSSSVVAPITPPVTLLSSPMIAFCTVFDSVSSTTRSNGLSCASSRLPAEPQPDDQEHVHEDRPQDLFGDRQPEHEHVVPHLRLHGGIIARYL